MPSGCRRRALLSRSVFSFSNTLLVLAFVGAAPGCGTRRDSNARARVVVLISIDTLRADHLRLYGGAVAVPHIDALAADGLVYRVMAERGYPMDNFEAQSKLISVDHPAVVENYRFAHGVCERAQSQQATTEDLRGALLRYRSLFDELLQSDDADRSDGGGARHAVDADDQSRQSTQRGAR